MKYLRILITELTYWLEWGISMLPFGIIGNGLRRLYWSGRLSSFREGTVVYPGVQFVAAENIRVGRSVSINRNVIIDASQGSIEIGNDSAIGPNSVIRAADHIFTDQDRLIREQGHASGSIVIGDDCWLGANVVVLRNVTIGRGSVIGAGAVVNRDIPAYSIAVGVPARVIGSRGDTQKNETG